MTNFGPVDILLIHDQPVELNALQKALQPLGSRVLTANSATQASAVAATAHVSAVVVALRSGAIDGLAVAARLRRELIPSLPVVFVSHRVPEPATLSHIHKLGTADFLLLPAPPEALRSRVAMFAELHLLRQTALQTSRSDSAALPTEAEHMRLLSDAVSDYALLFMDNERRLTQWSAGAEHLFGFTSAEVLGRSADLIFTPEDRAHDQPATEQRQAAEHGQAADERMHVRKDGSRFPAMGRLIALHSELDGKPRGFAKIVWDATQLRRLEESERKFREIFEAANEGIWILDANGRVQVVNQRMSEMIGYAIAEIIGRHKSDFTFPEDRPYIEQLFAERRAGRIVSSVDVRFRHKNGHAVSTLLSARPMFRNGEFSGALDMFTDVTERLAAEQRFRLFFESSAAGHALVDPRSRRFVAVNQRFETISGRSREQLQHLTYTDITHPGDRAEDERMFGAMAAADASEVEAEKRYVRPDGSITWVHLTSTIVRDENAVPKLQLTVVQDITERKNTETELEESRTRLRLAIEAAELGVFYHDGETGKDTWNDRAKQLLGLAPEEEPSYEAFMRRVDGEDRERVTRTLEPLFQPGVRPHEFDLQCRVLAPEGLRYIAVNGVTEPRADATGTIHTHIVGTVRDITAAKEFELELQQKVDQRTRELQDKTNQLESFCYTVAHDLRAPLRAINGYADILGEEFGALDRDATLQYVDRIKGSTRRLDQLIRDLLAYSRITQVGVTLERVDLGEAVATALREIEGEVQRRAAVVEVAAKLPVVWGERSMVEQILVNLLSNAVKFTPTGRQPHVEVVAETHDPLVRLSVRDQGIGIPQQYQDRIFKVFERLQAARDYPGTGIGLAIVARAMERLGGRYGVESVPGQGSTFWIELHRAPK